MGSRIRGVRARNLDRQIDDLDPPRGIRESHPGVHGGAQAAHLGTRDPRVGPGAGFRSRSVESSWLLEKRLLPG